MTDQPGFGKETHSTYEPTPEEVATRRVTDPAAHTPDWSKCNCGAGPNRIHSRWCALAAAHTPDVDALVETLERRIAFIATDGTIVCRFCNASDVTDDGHRVGCPVIPILAALSDLAATARERDEVAEDARVVRAERLLIFEKLQAAEADRDRLRSDLVSVRAECDRFDAEGDRLARRVAELEARSDRLVTLVRVGFLVSVNGERATADTVREPELRDLLMTILQAKDIEAACAALAGDGGGPRYGCAPGCRADMDAGLHKPECRVPPSGDGGGAPACDHEWIDMRNKDIESGEWCPKCGTIRAGNEATGGDGGGA